MRSCTFILYFSLLFWALFSFGDVKSGKAYFKSLFSVGMNFDMITIVGIVIMVGMFWG